MPIDSKGVLAGLRGRRERRLVATEAVEQDGVRPLRVLHGGPLAAGGGGRDHAADQLGRRSLLAADPGQRDRRVRADAGPGRLLDGIDLRDRQGAPAKSPPNAAA
jgi:hypothetical protein